MEEFRTMAVLLQIFHCGIGIGKHTHTILILRRDTSFLLLYNYKLALLHQRYIYFNRNATIHSRLNVKHMVTFRMM